MAGFPAAYYTSENAPASADAYESKANNITPGFINDINTSLNHQDILDPFDQSSDPDFLLKDANFDGIYGDLKLQFPKLGNNEPGASAYTCDMLQESSTCTARRHVYDPSPSLTVFETLPPPSTLVEMECLPAPANFAATNFIMPQYPSSNPLQYNHLLNTGFSPELSPANTAVNYIDAGQIRSSTSNFLSDPILGYPSCSTWPGFVPVDPVGKASISHMLPASDMDINNSRNADATNSVQRIPELRMKWPADAPPLLTGNQIHAQSLGFSCCNLNSSHTSISIPGSRNFETTGYKGAVSESEAMDCTCASGNLTAANSLSYQIPTQLNPHHGMSLSAPVSPASPMVNHDRMAPHGGFHEVEDMGSVRGCNLFYADISQCDKTHYYKMLDKRAWRNNGGIQKRRHARRTSHSGLDSGSPCNVAGGKTNANSRSTGQRHMQNAMHNSSGVLFKLKTETLNLDDGFRWKKYGEKVIKGEKHPRTYLRCDESERSGCMVLKRTQRCSDDDDYVHFFYFGRHNHDKG